MNSRNDIIGKPGIYLDTTSTGGGKSTADTVICGKVSRALIVVPTHKNGKAVEKDMETAGLAAKCYPGRHLDGDEQNCWNEATTVAESFGLSVVASVCPTCPRRTDCGMYGYLGQIAEVQASPIAIATHARATYNGTDELASGRNEYVVIHEDAAEVLSPDDQIAEAELESAAVVIGLILNDPKYLDWLGQSTSKDDDGNWVPNEKLAERRDKLDRFLRHLADVIDSLREQIKTVTKTQKAEIGTAVKKATGIERLLLRATIEAKAKCTWRLLLAAAGGELYSLGIIVDDSSIPSGKKKVVVGTWNNTPSEKTVFLCCDATTTQDELEATVRRPVINITPEGYVERANRVVQFPKDITRRTKRDQFLAAVRGVMLLFPNAQRIGIITHRPLLPFLRQIGDPFLQRIRMTNYYGSGEDRASNDWHGQCDLIIVAGTPRVPGIAVQRRMVQFGDFGPAGENPNWGEILWRGQTESGKETLVSNRGYRHPVWMRAHRSLVRAKLIQAAGRGRSILESGCEVAIVSTEECGFPLADKSEEHRGTMLTNMELQALKYMLQLSAQNLTLETLEALYAYKVSRRTVLPIPPMSSFVPMLSTAEIAMGVGLQDRRTRIILSGLESRGLVSRSDDRGGWMLTEAGYRLVSHSPELVTVGGVA